MKNANNEIEIIKYPRSQGTGSRTLVASVPHPEKKIGKTGKIPLIMN